MKPRDKWKFPGIVYIDWGLHFTHSITKSLFRSRLIVVTQFGQGHQVVWSSLVQVMVCRLFSGSPLPGPIMTYCQLDPRKQILVKFESKYNSFLSRNRIRKRRFQNGGHFIHCPACRTSLIATRFWVVVICPIIKCLTVLEFYFILFDLCLFITIFNFVSNYVRIVTFWIFTYHKIWILLIIFCFIWSYWIIYFLTCLEVFWSVVS